MLYIVATPIGNLQDITYRAVETLKTCDYILAEDTRNSVVLLKHYGIETRLYSFHEHNEEKKAETVIEDLKQGKNIALISDAGTPLVSDPGEGLVQKCIEANVAFTSLPGPCALITALTLSGLATIPFQFVGFLEKKSTSQIQALLGYEGTTICYESPQRIQYTLKTIGSLDPHRQCVVARELTKKFETLYRGTALEVLALLEASVVKGEIVLLIAQKTARDPDSYSDEEIIKAVLQYQKEYVASSKEAIAAIASEFGIQKRRVYQLIHTTDN